MHQKMQDEIFVVDKEAEFFKVSLKKKSGCCGLIVTLG
jgi:hypothetical protein